jgi:preprotein translocase subunit SecE
MAKNKFVEYVAESYDELMHKVSWPTWSELQNSAVVVSIASLIIAFAVFMMDEVFQLLLNWYYTLL